MGEWLLLASVLMAAALAIAWPFIGRPADATPPDEADPEREAREVRHRLALEALRDVEADHRAGSLDEASYATQRAEAEREAARTLAALEATPSVPSRRPSTGAANRIGLAIGAVLVVALLAGFAAPQPFGIGQRTATNQALADAIAQEQARQVRIQDLLGKVAADPSDTQALSDLADAYLAGGSAEDLQRAATALLLLINAEPEDASAYRRLITAYINAGDWTDARASLDAFTTVADADEPDVPFFAGLIALRGENDSAEAVRQFDRFLELAPDNPRAAMIRSLRAEAAGELPGP